MLKFQMFKSCRKRGFFFFVVSSDWYSLLLPVKCLKVQQRNDILIYPLSLVRIIEELLEWKSSGSGSRKPRLRPWGSLRWPRDILYQLKLALTSPTGCGRSVGIVRLRTKTTELLLFIMYLILINNNREGSYLDVILDSYCVSVCAGPKVV
jgi:hypothetical protein